MAKVSILKASAGSGKTYMLAYNFVRSVIIAPAQYKHILGVTFTNKATEEMKRRILKEINDLANGCKTSYLDLLKKDTALSEEDVSARARDVRTRILHDYSHFSIMTIDKFFQRIIRSFIKELGLDLNFNLELQTDTLLSSAADMMIEQINTDSQLNEWIAGFVGENIDDSKKWDIRTDLKKLGGELFKESYRSKRGFHIPKEVLLRVVGEFTEKERNVRDIFKQSGQAAISVMIKHNLSVSDFAGGSRSFANYFLKAATGDPGDYGTSVAKALETEEKWYSKTTPRKNDILAAVPHLMPLLQTICSTYDDNLELLNTSFILRKNFRSLALLQDLEKQIENICTTENIVPIAETNLIIEKLISDNDTPFIFEKAGNYYSRFLIDEFQDTSEMQWKNFLPLLQNAVSMSGEQDNPILLVGDIKQSIYRWRGGSWKILSDQVEKEFDSVEVNDLKVNYRSYGRIVNFNNELLSLCIDSGNEYLNNLISSAKDEGRLSADTFYSLKDTLSKAYDNHSQKSASEDNKGFATITVYDGKQSQPPVIRQIEELQDRGFEPQDIAILVRYNSEGSKLANMLLEHKRNNPDSKYCYDIISQEALIISHSPVIGLILALMRLSRDKNNSVERVVVNRYFRKKFKAELDETTSGLLDKISLLSVLEAFENIVETYGLDQESHNIAYLQAFEEQIISFENRRISDIPLFLKWWDESGSTQSINLSGSSRALNIISIHKSKGLQYKAVIIPFCNWALAPRIGTTLWAASQGRIQDIGSFPVNWSDKSRNSYFSSDHYEEMIISHVDSMNIFYVAVTRAIAELHIMIPDEKESAALKISSLVRSNLRLNESSVQIGEHLGRIVKTDDYERYEFGEPTFNPEKDEHSSVSTIEVPYSSFLTEGRLRLKRYYSRYNNEAYAEKKLPARIYGMVMHTAFQTANNIDDIMQSLMQMQADGLISKDQYKHLRATIDTAFKNELVRSWFDDTWDEVRNENDIILPMSVNTKRPDRMLIKDKHAVVIDYKFGELKSSSHIKQIKEYMSLARQMDYEDVCGYIWYVNDNDIMKVEL